jgi:hypothetical protein
MTQDEVEILYPKKAKAFWLFICCLTFVIIGFWMFHSSSKPVDKLLSVVGIAFFGLGAVVALIVLFVPNSSYLQIDPQGIQIRSLWRTHTYLWSDIEIFAVSEFYFNVRGIQQGHQMVCFSFSQSFHGKDKAKLVKSWNKKLTGYDAGLPDNYGWSYERLAGHLNRKRIQYLSLTGESSAVNLHELLQKEQDKA